MTHQHKVHKQTKKCSNNIFLTNKNDKILCLNNTILQLNNNLTERLSI